MKIIDGTDAIMGRLASYVAKQALKGEEIVILNCDKVIITGNKKNIEKEFKERRGRIGSSQKGPKHHRVSYKVVKRAIRGMLPDHRSGRGKQAFRRIICHNGVPKEFEDKKKITSGKQKKAKFIRVKEMIK